MCFTATRVAIWVAAGQAWLVTAPSKLRWLTLALVFAASAINYADRQIIALLKPVLEAELGWSQADYSHLISAFQLATAASLIAAGFLVDKIGWRRGYAWGVSVWSLAAMAHGIARTLGQFTIARAVLGAAETINTPAAVKTVASIFPLKERSLAHGVANCAPNVGSILVPLIVPALAIAFGWRMAFIITGGTGFIWLVVWLIAGRQGEAPREPSPPAATIGRATWLALLRDRRTWAVAGAKLLSDQSWWFLLFWAPDFFNRRYGLGIGELGPPLALVYGLAAMGALTGGWASTRFLARGHSVNRVRKGVMLAAALLVTPIPFVLLAPSPWIAAVMLGIALFGHQAFSTNLFALTTDVFPAPVVGSVIGIAATVGTLGGMGILEFTGWTLDRGGGYLPMFLVCAVAYLAALAWIHLLLPVIRPAES